MTKLFLTILLWVGLAIFSLVCWYGILCLIDYLLYIWETK